MSDRLENYIKDNREEMDHMEPPIGMWQRIEKGSQKNKGLNLNNLWKAAALIFLVLSIGLWLNRPTVDQVIAENENINGELLQVEQYYTSLINEKIDIITSNEALSPAVEKEFLQDVEKLDSAYQQLKFSLETTPSDKIKDAMIVNLQMRIELLNQQLEILEKIKSVKKDEKAYSI